MRGGIGANQRLRPSNGGSCLGCECAKSKRRCLSCLCGDKGQCDSSFNKQEQQNQAPTCRKGKRSSKVPKYLDEFELAEKTDEDVNSDEEKHVETSEAGSEEDAKDDGKGSFNMNQPISPAEDGLPPFIKASKPDFQWGGRSGENLCNDINTGYFMTLLRFGEKTSLNFRAALRQRSLYKN